MNNYTKLFLLTVLACVALSSSSQDIWKGFEHLFVPAKNYVVYKTTSVIKIDGIPINFAKWRKSMSFFWRVLSLFLFALTLRKNSPEIEVNKPLIQLMYIEDLCCETPPTRVKKATQFAKMDKLESWMNTKTEVAK